MLEIKNLVKVYKTKGGAEVRALDGVSVRFEEKGMIFLLGKSGSGKSTLLNLCGGLDSPDSGEIIIKGKSSKDFTQSDFDSYRNTFVGFVFQEYNILNEFTVEDNIALALELQGKNKDRKRVREILEQVELESFAKRKPNTLSGGQKQRVAIARPLVKNPEIIMADEPTGALDSNTGKQVFDTLKKLSKDKLVIVVSHDREFAEIYGDRIIELKDGKIISDVTKTKIEATASGEYIRFIGTDTVSIKRGASLSDEDMNILRRFLSNAESDVIIAGGKKEVDDFKKVARIDENGARESFKQTDEKEIERKAYTPQDSKFIRSKLPARHALRIGASSMKVKPFRLFFTILLSFIAFTMFGMFSTLTFYDSESVMTETYEDSGYQYLYLQNNYQYDYVYYENGVEESRRTYDRTTCFTPADIAKAKEQYGEAHGAYTFSDPDYGYSESFSIENIDPIRSDYYQPAVYAFIEVSENTPAFELLTDTDLSALADNEIVIPSYLFDCIRESETKEYGDLENYSDIVGKPLTIYSRFASNDVTLAVRGVYRCDPPEKYATIEDGTEPQDSSLRQAFSKELSCGMYGAVLVSPEFYGKYSTELNNDGIYKEMFTSIPEPLRLLDADYDSAESDLLIDFNFSALAAFSDSSVKPSHVHFFGEDKTALADNEIIVNYYMYRNFLNSAIFYRGLDQWSGDAAYQAALEQARSEYRTQNEAECDEYYQEMYQQYVDGGSSDAKAQQMAESDLLAYIDQKLHENDPNFYTELDEIRNDAQDEYYKYDNILSNGMNENGFTASEQELAEAVAYLENLITKIAEDSSYDLSIPETALFDRDGTSAYSGTFRIVGFYYGEDAGYESGLFFSSAVYDSLNSRYGYHEEENDPSDENYTGSKEETKYERSEDAIYNYIVVPFPDRSALRTIIAEENAVNEADGTFYTLYSPISDQFGDVNSMLTAFEQIFLWVGVVMAVFSMLLLFNFISVSITYKKKEIGILRAVGARSADVFKIFYSESAIIAVICFALAMAACFILCPILNREVAGVLGASIFVFGPLSWLVMLGIAVITSMIATFLPVYGIAKRKPVESIRSL